MFMNFQQISLRITEVLILFISTVVTVKAEKRLDSLKYGPFEQIQLYHPEGKPESLVLFVSGDGGWNEGVIQMAKSLATEGAMVAGIDIRHYLKSLYRQKLSCFYPAADFERLSLMLQKKFHFPAYQKPVLVGYSSGATLVYAMLVQAPANTFKGALSLGFCPDLKTWKQLCEGAGLKSHKMKAAGTFFIEKAAKLSAPFIVLNGITDQVCPYEATKEFLSGMVEAELITLSKVGHGFSVHSNWMPQFMDAYKKILQAPSFTQVQESKNEVLKRKRLDPLPGDMPLSVIPTVVKSDAPLVFMISGDGGWTSFDQSLAEALAGKKLTVIGLDAQKYFWNEKTPRETSSDVSKAVLHYLQQYQKESFILAGYSFGASVVPFIASRLNEQLKQKLIGVVSLSPEVTADFEIHVADMLGVAGSGEDYDVLREEQKIKAFHPICYFGQQEDAETAELFKKAGIKVGMIPGSHHFDNNYSLIASRISDFLDVK
ncbi:AcvB/VirJ family lysyl-phosphatidylglycerol hydrolase [Arcticibacter eurypsychrophilus]|uniref:AcvB/VirJ family lysyl-phosphatidylglycerol hydrolase n=1 Tax=Arcticibacter eurypsychrophilus TaxID=1434752 RepID=UPI000AE22812|nr:AcvB/VirJ family lysyl-phosphatidylglycerol hydrolase [Arcticibacter eurypsychrophilus]